LPARRSKAILGFNNTQVIDLNLYRLIWSHNGPLCAGACSGRLNTLIIDAMNCDGSYRALMVYCSNTYSGSL